MKITSMGNLATALLAYAFGLGAIYASVGRADEPAKPGSISAAIKSSPAVKSPTPNRSDEPIAKKLSLAKAAEFLDAAGLNWTQQRHCGSCHTNYPYLIARPLVKGGDARSLSAVRSFFEDRAAHWDTKKPLWDTEVVATASALAFHDAETTGKLHPLTRSALDRMWKLQRPAGSWEWLKCNWQPAEADDYYGVIVAALGTGIAPEHYVQTTAARAGLEKIRHYLESNTAPSLHHKIMLLWASCYIADLMPTQQRDSLVRELLELQRPDGGWSLPALGNWMRHSGEPNDAKNAPSDGYATGLVVYVLRQTGLAKDHEAIQKGVSWLSSHQRESGRWFTRSVNNDRYHYITHAGSAYAVMALRACGVE
jgi:squalene-hopene/tetraprenyl-beta-curcumene cyclase